jgi:hypothetical protein
MNQPKSGRPTHGSDSVGLMNGDGVSLLTAFGLVALARQCQNCIVDQLVVLVLVG